MVGVKPFQMPRMCCWLQLDFLPNYDQRLLHNYCINNFLFYWISST